METHSSVKISDPDARTKMLEKRIREIASAPTELERNARIEIALAEVEGRTPEEWAMEYMDYATNQDGQYF